MGPKYFTMGEIDATFTKTELIIKAASSSPASYKVQTIGGDTFMLKPSNGDPN